MTGKPDQVDKLVKGACVIIALDSENSTDLRRDHMFGHLNHIEKYSDLYRDADPLKTGEGEFYSSLFMLNADCEEDVRSIIADDPYVTCGMFETVTVYPFIPACGEWIGGVTWDQDVVRANMDRYS